MINSLMMKLQPVARGFDPVPRGYAETYAEHEWTNLNTGLIDELERRVGGFQGKRVLDLGAGPGQYAIEFARRGARVTWHDISRNYLAVARSRAAAHGAELDFSLGYLEEAARYLDDPFDFLFNRICWYYCADDFKFARLVRGLIRPGGWGYIDNFIHHVPSGLSARYWVNARMGIKIGHPVPPPGRVEKLLRSFGDLDLEVIQRSDRSERLFLKRRPARG